MVQQNTVTDMAKYKNRESHKCLTGKLRLLKTKLSMASKVSSLCLSYQQHLEVDNDVVGCDEVRCTLKW